MLFERGQTERLRRRFEKYFEKISAKLQHRTRKMHRRVKAAYAHGKITGPQARELQTLIYDFQLEHGMADSQFGLRRLDSMKGAASFRRSLFQQFRRDELQPFPVGDLFRDKQATRKFMRGLGARVPACSEPMTFEEALETIDSRPPFDAMVLKPLQGGGGNGVFIIRGPRNIFQFRGRKNHTSYKEMEEAARRVIAERKLPLDNWIIEELVTRPDALEKPPRDLKFYCFYGRVGLVLESDWIDGKRRMSFWTGDSEPTTPARGYDRMSGSGVRSEDVAFAAELSARLPLPYVRLDFLEGPDGLVFGEMSEFTGKFERYPRSQDRRLGEYYLDAQSRLYLDLLRGKQFPEFMEIAKKNESLRKTIAKPVH